MMAEYEINARGLQCPGPIVKLFNQSKLAQPGDVIKIEVTDHGFTKDVVAWCKKSGWELVDMQEENNVIRATLRKN